MDTDKPRERIVTLSWDDAFYLEGIMIWVREHEPEGKAVNEQFIQVERRLNIAVANSREAK